MLQATGSDPAKRKNGETGPLSNLPGHGQCTSAEPTLPFSTHPQPTITGHRAWWERCCNTTRGSAEFRVEGYFSLPRPSPWNSLSLPSDQQQADPYPAKKYTCAYVPK